MKTAVELLQAEILKVHDNDSWAMIKNSVLKVFMWDQRSDSGNLVPSGYSGEERQVALTGFDVYFRQAMDALVKRGVLVRERHSRLKTRNGRLLMTGRAVYFTYRRSDKKVPITEGGQA